MMFFSQSLSGFVFAVTAKKNQLLLLLALPVISMVLVPSAASQDVQPDPTIRPGTIHPTAENLSDDAEVDFTIRTTDQADADDGTLQQVLLNLSSTKPIKIVGTEDGYIGPQMWVFGDVTTDRSGKTYVLNGYNGLLIFDKDGRLIQTFGGRGGGEISLGGSNEIASDPQDKLFVLDRSRFLRIFSPQHTTYNLELTIPLDYNPDALCLKNDRVYVRGYRQDEDREDNMIHVYSLSGEHLHSFGETYKAPNTFVKEMLSRGYALECNEKTQTIVTMFENLPFVYGYTTDGTLKWKVRLADFKPAWVTEKLSERDTASIHHAQPDEGATFARHLTMLHDGHILVQLMRAGMGDNVYRTYLLSAEDGHGTYIGEDLPQLFAGQPGELLAVKGDMFADFTQLLVYAIE